jgi:hypothetical protein
LTTGGTVGADGRTGELAHKAAEVSCVTNLALENESSFRPSPEDVRNTFFNFDFSPGKTVLVRSNTVLGKITKHIRESDKAMPDTTTLNHCYKAKTVTEKLLIYCLQILKFVIFYFHVVSGCSRSSKGQVLIGLSSKQKLLLFSAWCVFVYLRNFLSLTITFGKLYPF